MDANAIIRIEHRLLEITSQNPLSRRVGYLIKEHYVNDVQYLLNELNSQWLCIEELRRQRDDLLEEIKLMRSEQNEANACDC